MLPIDPTITDLLQARRFLASRVRHTPTEHSFALSDLTGGRVVVKWENQQLCGSFKIRGALNKMYSLTPEEKQKGVVTCSSGNHGQGAARAASELGVRLQVIVPGNCPVVKMEAIRRYGGKWVELVPWGENYDDAEAHAHHLAEAENRTYVSSFEDAKVIAGAGTGGFEMFCDEPDIDVLLVPAGGGGLMNGYALAAKTLRPSVQIWGVQTEASNPWVISWNEGIVKQASYKDTIADGLFGGIPQSLLDLSKTRVDGILEVTEKKTREAIAFLHREHHQVVEGAGAVTTAALLSRLLDLKGRNVGIVVSGGNIDEERLLQILEENKN